jgi:prevent-host-death family protein
MIVASKPMLQVNVHEAKTNLSRYLARAEAGETIVIAKGGKPIAHLTPLPGSTKDASTSDPRWFFGSMANDMVFSEQASREMDEEIAAMFDAAADKLE